MCVFTSAVISKKVHYANIKIKWFRSLKSKRFLSFVSENVNWEEKQAKMKN